MEEVTEYNEKIYNSDSLPASIQNFNQNNLCTQMNLINCSSLQSGILTQGLIVFQTK